MTHEEALQKFEQKFKELALNSRLVRVYLADLIKEIQENG
jgi:hypothetical protein